MSFRVFAVGAGDFHFVKDGCLEGSDFDTMKTVSTLSTMEPSKMGVAGAAADKYLPSAGLADLAGSVATLEFLHLLNDTVDWLAVNAGDDSSISVFAKQPHPLWPDTVRFSVYNFAPGDNPGAEFVRTIGQGLKDTDLDNFGVLAALVSVLAKYSDFITGKPITPRINIELTKSS